MGHRLPLGGTTHGVSSPKRFRLLGRLLCSVLIIVDGDFRIYLEFLWQWLSIGATLTRRGGNDDMLRDDEAREGVLRGRLCLYPKLKVSSQWDR